MTDTQVCTGSIPEVLLSRDIDTRVASWRVARALEQLRDQVNLVAPSRSKLSDGSIGDLPHCGPGTGQISDHCPRSIAGLGSGIVTARDITHDPDDGADMHEIAEQLRLSRDRRIKYVIWSRRIFSATVDPWRWRPYSGDNAHDKHMHVSVVPTALADNTAPWEITVPLTNDDVKRVADATAARVLGKNWALPGRTLVGTLEAALTYAQTAAAAAPAVGQLTIVAQDILKAAHNDSESAAVIPTEVRVDLAQQIVAGTLAGFGAMPLSSAAEALRAVYGDRFTELINAMRELNQS